MIQRRSSPARKLLKLGRTSAAVAAFVTALHHTGYFDALEARWVDAMGRLFQPNPSGQVVFVAITDDDFSRADLFASTSPLHPATLNRLIERIASHRPALVAVDLQLQPAPHESGDRLTGRLQLYETLLHLARQEAPEWVLVQPEPWQLDARGVDPQVQMAWERLLNVGTGAEGRPHWASAEMRAERGLIRHMALDLGGRGSGEAIPTILGAIVKTRPGATRAPPNPSRDEHKALLIRYSGGFLLDRASLTAVPAGALLDAPAPTGQTVLHGKIVILGGTHRASRDFFWTPFGEMPAAAIWAEAADTWVRGDEPGALPWPLAFFIETLIGLGGGLLMLRFHPILGYGLAVLVLAPVTLFFSWLSFAIGFVFVNCLPSFFAVQLHQRVEVWRENRELRRRNRELEHELRAANIARSPPLAPSDIINGPQGKKGEASK
jgi:CHASE2 domain-containing sensor protein